MNTTTEERIETGRLARLLALNLDPEPREALEQHYGMVWNTQELKRDFTVIRFCAPFVVVRRRSDRVRGSLEFQHEPRFYFNWIEGPPE